MSEKKLKPCPFHNCLTCGCYDTLYMRDKDWNTRPIEDALIARAERAEAMVERMIEAGKKLSIIALLNTREDIETWERWHALVAEWQARNG